MPDTPRARYTQAEVERAVRAARRAGAHTVELPGGIVIRLDAPTVSAEDAGHQYDDVTWDR